AHDRGAILLDPDREVLGVVDLVARDDPRTQAGEGIEALADVPGVLPAPAPGIALAEVPQDRVAEYVIERRVLAHAARCLADDRAQLAFEIPVPRDAGQDHRAARADDRRDGLQEELRHQLVLGEARAVVRIHLAAHFGLVGLVVRRGSP